MFQRIDVRWWQAAFWLLFLPATILMLLPADDLPDVDIWDKAEHAGTFLFLMVFAWLGYRRHCSPLLLAQLLIAYGITIECIQFFIPSRSFSVLDMVADAIGVLPVYCLAIKWPLK